jgi:dinuclear metal center YbgI/SA1388 family protein
MRREELSRYLDELLEVSRYRDYSPNGLQVEGRAEIARIVTGVTASAALIDAAIDVGADALLVHHGYFWRGEDARLTGVRRQRIGRLIAADLNLYAFHLPLDGHLELGNNAQLGARLGFVREASGGEQDLVWVGRPSASMPLRALGANIERALGRTPLVVGPMDRVVARVAWCTGGAQSFFEQAIGLGADAYVTGEISEQHFHLASESGVGFIAAGHHATERFGIQALGAHLAQRFGLAHQFIDVLNPV